MADFTNKADTNCDRSCDVIVDVVEKKRLLLK